MKKTQNRVLVGLSSLLIATLLVWEGQAQSQEAYPTRPIEIIVVYPAGGGSDLVSRVVASALSKKWGVPMNVVNKPGGNAIPGILYVYNARPDGYTILADINSISSMLAVGVKDLPFKILDRTFVSTIATLPHVFYVATNSPFKSMKDVGAEARRDPGNFTWTVNGTGYDSQGIANRQFFQEIGVDPRKTRPIRIRGAGEGPVMVAGGNSIMGCNTLTTAVSFLKGGTVRPLAVTSKNRDSGWPDVPTTAEAGYPNVNVLMVSGFSGPPNLPAFIVAKWEKALEEVLKDPELIAKMKSLGLTPVFLNSKETREFIIKETEEITKIDVGSL